MSQIKSGYILLMAVVVILIGALILNGRPLPPQPDPEATPPYYRLFPQINTLEQIEWMGLGIRAEAVAIGVSQGELGNWYWLDDPGIAVDGAMAEQAREVLASMTAFQFIERDPNAPQDYGFLPEPQYVVLFGIRGVGEPIAMYIGDKTPNGLAYYVSPNPNASIIDLVSVEWIDTFVMLMRALVPTQTTPTP
jgi:hypothetical protein